MRDVSTWRLMVRLYGPWRKRLIFFALCVALGVGALFSVGNLLSVMTEHIGDRARTMLGGDVRISSWQRLDATARDHLNGALAEWPDAATTDTREMASMVKRVQRRPTAKTSGEDRPFLVRKSDGAFLYSTTDVATIRHRVETFGARQPMQS